MSKLDTFTIIGLVIAFSLFGFGWTRKKDGTRRIGFIVWGIILVPIFWFTRTLSMDIRIIATIVIGVLLLLGSIIVYIQQTIRANPRLRALRLFGRAAGVRRHSLPVRSKSRSKSTCTDKEFWNPETDQCDPRLS